MVLVLPAQRVARSGHGRVAVRRQGCHQAGQLHRELVRVAVIGAELGGDVRDLVQAEDAGDGVADGGHRALRAAVAAGILPGHDITDIVVHLDGPVAAQVSEQVSGAGLVRREAGDAQDGDRAGQFPADAVAVALDEEHLLHVREQLPDPRRGRQGLDGTDVDAAVAPVDGPGWPAIDSQGSAPAAANSRGWFSPMVKMKKAPTALIFRACPRWVCIWSYADCGIMPMSDAPGAIRAGQRDLCFRGVGIVQMMHPGTSCFRRCSAGDRPCLGLTASNLGRLRSPACQPGTPKTTIHGITSPDKAWLGERASDYAGLSAD